MQNLFNLYTTRLNCESQDSFNNVIDYKFLKYY